MKPLALALFAVAATACTDAVDSIHRTVTASTGAQFDVEVRYAGGATAHEAEALLATIAVVPAREAFPGVDVSQIPDDDGELEANEPSFAVALHPLDEAAAGERYAWRGAPPLVREQVRADGLGELEQGLSVDADVPLLKYIAAGDSWRTSLYRCYAPFGFAADFTGMARACVDMGYQGKAGTRCTWGYDPRDPVITVHDGVPDDITDWSPLSEHWFRGRVTAGALIGYGTGALLHAWGVVCL